MVYHGMPAHEQRFCVLRPMSSRWMRDSYTGDHRHLCVLGQGVSGGPYSKLVDGYGSWSSVVLAENFEQSPDLALGRVE